MHHTRARYLQVGMCRVLNTHQLNPTETLHLERASPVDACDHTEIAGVVTCHLRVQASKSARWARWPSTARHTEYGMSVREVRTEPYTHTHWAGVFSSTFPETVCRVQPACILDRRITPLSVIVTGSETFQLHVERKPRARRCRGVDAHRRPMTPAYDADDQTTPRPLLRIHHPRRRTIATRNHACMRSEYTRHLRVLRSLKMNESPELTGSKHTHLPSEATTRVRHRDMPFRKACVVSTVVGVSGAARIRRLKHTCANGWSGVSTVHRGASDAVIGCLAIC